MKPYGGFTVLRTPPGAVGRYLLDFRRSLAALQQRIDLDHGIADCTDRHIVVDRRHKVSGVLGAVNIKIPAALQQLRLPVG